MKGPLGGIHPKAGRGRVREHTCPRFTLGRQPHPLAAFFVGSPARSFLFRDDQVPPRSGRPRDGRIDRCQYGRTAFNYRCWSSRVRRSTSSSLKLLTIIPHPLIILLDASDDTLSAFPWECLHSLATRAAHVPNSWPGRECSTIASRRISQYPSSGSSPFGRASVRAITQPEGIVSKRLGSRYRSGRSTD